MTCAVAPARARREQERRVVWELKCFKWQCHDLPHRPGVVDERRAIARLAELQHEAVVLMKAASQRQRLPPCFLASSGDFVAVDFSDYTSSN